MQQVRIAFTAEKETKNTVKYAEQQPPGKPQVIGALYVQKWWAQGAQLLTVTIEREGEEAPA